ncbi:MAG: hypothetical protein EXR93_06755 [Gemmatimonadetes bacterium]|nr:hypothetical protein [Gemmatimonadota bacterium]
MERRQSTSERGNGGTGERRPHVRTFAPSLVLVVALVALFALSLPASAQDTLSIERVVRGLSFKGNRAIDAEILRNSISTSRSSQWQWTALLRWTGFGQKRYFDETEFRRDVLRLTLLYRQSGFFETKIDTVVIRKRADVWIRVLIVEGEPVRIGSVTVEGVDGVQRPQDLRTDLPLVKGDPFSRFKFRATADTIRSRLQNRGYPYAEVYRNYDEVRGQRIASVRYSVVPGPRVKLGKIVVTGTELVSPGVVRRAAGLAPGDLYRRDVVARSQIDLYRADVFSHVGVDIDTVSRPGPADSTITVRIDVAEGKFYQARVGAGYGTLDCLRGLVGWSGRNIFGGGRTFDLTGRVSRIGTDGTCARQGDLDPERLKVNYNMTAVLRQPAVFGHRSSAALSVFAERRSELNVFIRTAQGGELSVSQQVAWQSNVTLSYGLSVGRTIADPAIFCSLQNLCRTEDTLFSLPRRVSTLGASFLWDGSNSPLDASRGAVLSMQGRFASPTIGSDSLSQFLKGIVDLSAYHRFGRTGVFAWRVRIGGIAPPELGFTARAAKFVPPDERLYAGGPNSVRGYGQNELGPLVRVMTLGRDSLGNVFRDSDKAKNPDFPARDSTMRAAPTGGTRMVVGSLEVRAALPILSGRLSGALFLDAGQVFDPDRAVAERRLRFTPGGGLRLRTPLGPMRLDVAYRPYEQTAGPLYESRDGQLLPLLAVYQPPPPGLDKPLRRFWSHVKLNFSVGQAF